MDAIAFPGAPADFRELLKAARVSMLAGMSSSLVLYGISFCWLCRYWTQYKKDHWLLRLCVAAVFAADSLGALASFLSVYRVNVLAFDNPLALTERSWNWPVLVFSTTFAACCTSAFLTARLHKLVHKTWLTGILVFCTMASTGVGIAIGTITISRPITTIRSMRAARHLIAIWAICLAITHSTLCIAMVYHLTKLAEYQYVHTRRIIKRLTHLALSTEIFSLACVIALAILYYTYSIAAVAIYINLGRLYTLTLLLKLNIRRMHLEETQPEITDHFINPPLFTPCVVTTEAHNFPGITDRPTAQRAHSALPDLMVSLPPALKSFDSQSTADASAERPRQYSDDSALTLLDVLRKDAADDSEKQHSLFKA